MYDLERLLEELLETDASPGTLHLVLSKMKDRGRTSLVVQQCRKALNLHPHHQGLRTLLAEAYLDQGLAARASEELEQVTRRVDEAARAYKILADALVRQGRDAEAAASLDLYLAHRPDDAEAGEILARLRPPAPEAPSGEAGLEALSDEPIPEIATPTLAELYFSQGQIEAAVETYERILARSPNDARTLARLRELRALTEAPVEAPVHPEAAPAPPPSLEAEAVEPPPLQEETLEQELPEAAPVEELSPETMAQEPEPPEEAFDEMLPEPAPTGELLPEAQMGEAGLPEEAVEPEPPAPPLDAFPLEPAPPGLEGFEEEAPEEAAAQTAEQQATRRMIAVLEEWLTRIHASGTGASA
jgi:tetratricopeptide (TPR) repeat protein